MITFESLVVEGFASVIRKVEYPLDVPGVNIITGHNGAGKSTMIAALVWVIHGKLIGKDQVEPWEDIKPKKFSGTKVSLTFRKKARYELIRCHSYGGDIEGSRGKNRLVLKKDGVFQEHLRDKGDVQKEVLKIIGYGFEIFKNSIVLGQNITRILDERGDRQKTIMDEAFNTLYIQAAKKKAKKDQQKNWEDIIELEAEVEKYKSLLENNREAYKILKESRRNFLKQRNSDLARVKEEYQEINNSLQEVSKLKAQDEELELEEQELRTKLEKLLPSRDACVKAENQALVKELEISQKEGAIKDWQKEKEGLKDQLKKGNKCPTCGQLIKSKNSDTIKGNAKKLSQKIKIAQIECEEVRKELDKIDASKEKHKSKVDLYNKIEKELESLVNSRAKWEYYPGMSKDIKKNLKNKKEEYNRIKERRWDFSVDKLKSHKAKLKEFKSKLKPLNTRLKKLKIKQEILEWLIKDPLSNKGLKSFIFNQLLEEVSNRTRYYESFSGISLDFGIDLDSATKPLVVTVNQRGKSRPYKSLSGGQKQLANITASFAIHDVVSNTRSINILFLDEIFENLDKSNIQIVSELVSLRAKEQSIHLITHRSEFSIYNANIIEFSLDYKGRTRIAE